MNKPEHRALIDVLEFLRSQARLPRSHATPSDAMALFRELRARHGDGLALDLVWQKEAYDGSVHLDALMRVEGEGTASIAFAPDSQLPWPMRGMQRWADSDLVRVNGRTITVEYAMTVAEVLWKDHKVAEGLVNAALLEEEIERRNITATTEELQVAVNAFRKTNALFAAADMQRWMRERGVTEATLKDRLRGQVAANKLRDEIAAGRVESYFAEHHARFDVVRFAQVRIPGEADARAAADGLREGTLDFFKLAEEHYMGGEDIETFAIKRRKDIHPSHAEPIFAAEPGMIVGPMKCQCCPKCWDVVRVIGFSPAVLDAQTTLAIKDALYEEWLTARRREASIEWLWGEAPAAEAAE